MFRICLVWRDDSGAILEIVTLKRSTERTIRQCRVVAAMLALSCSVLAVGGAAHAQSPVFVGLGDSTGEGVQSADANQLTQPLSFLNIIAWRMGVPFPLPLIRTSPFASVSSTSGRSRLDPAVQGLNLAVSGATVRDVLTWRSDAATQGAINSEVDLVLFPRQATQMELVESLHPQVVACWIGNNDALGAVTDVDNLDGVSNLTPLAQFDADFTEVVQRIAATGAKAVFGTIPDVTRIGYLVDNTELVRFLGSDHGLPNGTWTTISTMFAIRLGFQSPTVLSNPGYVLDAAEAASINQRISEFNDVIRTTAAMYGMAVADTAAVFDLLHDNPPVIRGVPLTTGFLGGLFSLDGVHASNLGQAVTAAVFIDALNAHYGLAIPQIDPQTTYALFLTDPFIDKDRDGRVTGRPLAGLLETLGPLLGISGDSNDFQADSFAATASAEAAGVEFLAEYQRRTGRDLTRATPQEKQDALNQLFTAPSGRGAWGRR